MRLFYAAEMATRRGPSARPTRLHTPTGAASGSSDRPLLVSVIIPILDDTDALADSLASLPAAADQEIIVVNGGASDCGLRMLMDARLDVRWIDAPAGRGRQMNAGASRAQGRWLLFLHADTRLAA